MMKKGAFITFEGPDGSGKTTQTAFLKELLQDKGYEVICTREPGGTPAAEAIRAVVLDPALPICPEAETLLYLAARAEHVHKLIEPALAAGKIVLSDRFSDSTFVYQALSRGLDMECIRYMNNFATKALKPDLTFLLDGSPELLAVRRQDRGVDDRLELEGLDFQAKVREGFLLLAQTEPERIKVICALQEAAAVAAVVRAQVESLLFSGNTGK